VATLNPSQKIINNQKVSPTTGEQRMLDFLVKNLGDNFEIYWQPYLNGDQPDIIVVRPKSGVLIIEVKDWDLSNYMVGEKGRWQIRSNNQNIKSPLSQVNRYRWNIINLHVESFLEKTITNNSYYSLINRMIFFSQNTEAEVLAYFEDSYPRKQLRYLELFGSDSLSANRLQITLQKCRLEKDSNLFNEELYLNLKRYLKPPYHEIEDGLDIEYTNAQKELIKSIPGERKKISGVAGSGKTLVLAKRAVNAHKRTGKTVLILTFNISLKNYIHDKINDVRESFNWGVFQIVHYHQFFLSQANNYGVPIISLSDWENVKFFENVKSQIQKYDAIFIDEAQDYKSAWVKIITKYFLKENGEFVVFGDEKQNIYDRKLDKDKRPAIPGVRGRWNKSLNATYRFSGDIARLAMDFQKKFLSKKYTVDDFDLTVNQGDLFEGEKLIEYYLFEDYDVVKMHDSIMQIVKEHDLHPSDVGILDAKVENLRELDYLIRNSSKEKSKTMFETKEAYDFLLKELRNIKFNGADLSSFEQAEIELINNKINSELSDKLEDIRRNKKLHFYMKSGTMKLSTTHSFKGWEIPSLILVIDDETEDEEFTTEELIYTAFTRARFSLIIINLSKNKYDEFFRKKIECAYDVG